MGSKLYKDDEKNRIREMEVKKVIEIRELMIDHKGFERAAYHEKLQLPPNSNFAY